MEILTDIQLSSLQDFVIEVRTYAGEMTIEVHSEKIFEVLQNLKKQHGFNLLADITASDHYTDDGRFELSYNLVNLTDKARLRVSCRIEESNSEVQSVVPIWGAADWYEREAWDMMGIKFTDHPDLRRIYLPEDFEYHPLRKEFPQLGIPGSLQMPDKEV